MVFIRLVLCLVAGWLLLSCVVSFDTLVMAVSSVRYLASLVGMVTAAVVCGVRSTSVVRVWFSDGVVPEDVAERCGVVCDVFDFGLEFESIDVLRSWFVGRDPLLGGDVSPCAFAIVS